MSLVNSFASLFNYAFLSVWNLAEEHWIAARI